MAAHDGLQPAIVAWAFRVPRPYTTLGAEQFLRTQLHPDLYAAVNSLRSAMHSHGPVGIRRIANRIDVPTIATFYRTADDLWVQEAADRVDAYHAGDTSLADDFAELATMAAVFNDTVLHTLRAAVLATTAEQRWKERWHSVRQSGPVDPHRLLKEWHEVERSAGEQQSPDEALTDMTITPQYVDVNQNGTTVTYRMPASVRLFDSISGRHAVVPNRPHTVTRYEVDKQVSVPWDRAQQGLTLRICVTDDHGHSATENLHLDPRRMAEIAVRGSALPTTVGRFGHIRLHDEFFSAQPFSFSPDHDHSTLPDKPVASIRVRRTTVEVKKLHTAAQLTVFV